MKRLYFFVLLLCSSFGFYLNAEEAHIEPPRLLIKIPTRSRPQQFFEYLDLYYQKLSGKIPYHFLITCDDDDESMNNPETIEKLKTYPNLTFRFSQNISKVDAYNKDINQFVEEYNIILITSDDMLPVIDNYDLVIAYCMLKNFPDYDGMLHFRDGNHYSLKFSTYPIIGKKFYLRLGYAYYPGYVSFFCDNEITEIAQQMKKIKEYDTIILRHMYPISLKEHQLDSLYQRNRAFAYRDKELFEERKQFNFFLSSNQIVNNI